jgi:hypothetical protein
MSVDQSLRLRAQEIITSSPDGMTTRQGMKRALAERFKDDPAGLLEFAAAAGCVGMKDLRKRTYDLPEPGEGVLFDLPQIIGVSTPEGDLLVPREKATLGQVRQWTREGSQHHATQKLRFRRFAEELEPLKEESDELAWWAARAMLASESGAGE